MLNLSVAAMLWAAQAKVGKFRYHANAQKGKDSEDQCSQQPGGLVSRPGQDSMRLQTAFWVVKHVSK